MLRVLPFKSTSWYSGERRSVLQLMFPKTKSDFLPSEYKSDSENLAVLEVDSWL